MALNTLEYAKIFQTALDKQIRESATTGWMEANAGQVVASPLYWERVPRRGG